MPILITSNSGKEKWYTIKLKNNKFKFCYVTGKKYNFIFNENRIPRKIKKIDKKCLVKIYNRNYYDSRKIKKSK